MQSYKNQLLSIYPLPEISFKKGFKKSNIGLLVYDGNTCYADSVLMILLLEPNTYIRTLIERDTRLTTSNANKVRHNLTVNQNNTYRTNTRRILREIYNLIQTGPNNKGIVRQLLTNIVLQPPVSNNFTPGQPADPIPFLNELLNILGFGNVLFDKEIYGTNSNNQLNRINLTRLNRNQNLVERRQPVIEIHSYMFQGHNLSDSLIVDSIINGGFNLDNKRFRRRIEITNLPDTDIFIFNIYRRIGGPPGHIDTKEIIPDEYLHVNTGAGVAAGNVLRLTGIITRVFTKIDNGHYTARILCNNEWYFYNDIGSIFKKIGSGTYKEMLQYNNSTTYNVVCLYQKNP